MQDFYDKTNTTGYCRTTILTNTIKKLGKKNKIRPFKQTS